MAETRQFRKRTVAIGPSQGGGERISGLIVSPWVALAARCQISLLERPVGGGGGERISGLIVSPWVALLRLVVKSHYLSDLSLDTIVTRRCRVYLCVP